MKKIIAVAVMFGVLASFGFADAKGEEIAKKHFALKKSADTTAMATMVLIDKSGAKKSRKLTISTREGTEGKNSFIEFSEPADVSGTKFLTIAHQGQAAEQRLFLPALNKARKISSANKSGEFVNSDLFYYDMEDRSFADYSYVFLAEGEQLADQAFAGQKFYKVEMKAVAKDSPYAKSVAWINMENYAIAQIQCFDAADNSLWKTIIFPKYENQAGVLVPVQTLVTNHRKGSKTLLALSGLKVNSGVKAELFTVKNLEQ